MEAPATLVAELDAALRETFSPLYTTPTNLLAPIFLRECMLKVPVSGPFPNEWTAWCFTRRSLNDVFSQHENLRKIARDNGVDAYELADKLSTLCGQLFYFKLGGKMTAAERHLSDKMNY
jgi:hypothetical protein